MNELIEKINTYLSTRPGLVPLVGVILIIFNFILNTILQLFDNPAADWFVHSNIPLHIGLITSIIGLLVIRAWSD